MSQNVLTCKFRPKGTEPTWFVIFEVLRVPQH